MSGYLTSSKKNIYKEFMTHLHFQEKTNRQCTTWGITESDG